MLALRMFAVKNAMKRVEARSPALANRAGIVAEAASVVSGLGAAVKCMPI